MIQVIPIPAFNDNYIWCLTRKNSDYCYLVDPGCFESAQDYLNRANKALAGILVTHHHWDHTQGVDPLLAAYGEQVTVWASESGDYSFPHVPLHQGSAIYLDKLDLELSILATPGHTLDHICYYGDGMLFCGDTLFSGGCGRLFEGTAEQMHQSLSKLADLPDDTKVYCTHEYTLANLQFANWVEPNNKDLQAYTNQVNQLRSEQKISLPTSIGLEKAINPFLRCHQNPVAQQVADHYENPVEGPSRTFKKLRQWKDKA
ncbi:hydroxyacylglutathione hydrolase [Paraferrimonas sedimenticola]|uniref:Hydroxyacylglutathione hydrolase n=1 Tax=Paraferrimonas sedimenticola TaxID=375674 RepID=A0AA37RVQ5_9GAMM|nr:hydroxyacylglutathione hydrolase [Paraferrimonas sedimenticola]GLP96199.1 hydroxyacylglutathione hydrolase [Paraferrimonas sedimenticola]